MDLRVDGKRVFAHTGGRPFDPAKKAVILIHGAGMDHIVWQLQSRYFAHHGRSVLALDLPGHGRSEGPALDSVGALAEWLIRVMDAAGAETAALGGHSLGAQIAIEAAARHPGRISALALCGAAPEMPVHPDLLAAARGGDHLAYDLVTTWGYGRPAQIGHHRAPGFWMTGAGLRLLEASRNQVLGADMAAADAYKDGLASAAQIACPALLVVGAEDRMTPAKAGRKLGAAIAGAEVVELPGVGHMMMIEAPDATLDAMKKVL